MQRRNVDVQRRQHEHTKVSVERRRAQCDILAISFSLQSEGAPRQLLALEEPIVAGQMQGTRSTPPPP